MMFYVHLCDPGTLHFRDHGDETMKLAIQIQFLRDLTAKNLQRASVIFNVYTSHSTNEGICTFAGNFPEKHAILPVFSVSRHYIPIVAFQKIEHSGNVGRIVLKISIE